MLRDGSDRGTELTREPAPGLDTCLRQFVTGRAVPPVRHSGEILALAGEGVLWEWRVSTNSLPSLSRRSVRTGPICLLGRPERNFRTRPVETGAVRLARASVGRPRFGRPLSSHLPPKLCTLGRLTGGASRLSRPGGKGNGYRLAEAAR